MIHQSTGTVKHLAVSQDVTYFIYSFTRLYSQTYVYRYLLLFLCS